MVPTMCSVDEQSNTSQANDITICDIQDDCEVVSDSNTNSNSNSSQPLHALPSLRSSISSPITVYRDPNLAHKQIIRHIDSSQHNSMLMHPSITPSTQTVTVTTITPPQQQQSHQTQHQTQSQLAITTSVPIMSPQMRISSQVRTCQPSNAILPPNSAQFKLSHTGVQVSHAPQVSHSHSTHSSHSLGQQIFSHLMATQSQAAAVAAHPTHQTHYNHTTQPIDAMLWQHKPYITNNVWHNQVYNTHEHNNTSVASVTPIHKSDKQQSVLRIERNDEKEKLIKTDHKDSKEMFEKDRNDRIRQQELLLLDKEEKERKQREAVQQHFEESLRLAQQKKSISSWSPISSLPLTKSQQISRQSPIIPQLQHQQQQQQQQHHTNKPNMSYSARDYERDARHSEVKPSPSETERWMAYMQQQQHHHKQQQQQQQQQQQHHHQQQQQQQQQHSQHRANEMIHYQSTIMNGPSNTKPSITSPMMDTSQPKSQSHQQQHQQQQQHHSPQQHQSQQSQPQRSAKAEPSFSLYGYQPNQLSFITPAQLKENNRLNASNVLKVGVAVPPAAHSMEKRESPKMMDRVDRALTPSGRNSTPIGRPPSLSPKQQKLIKIERTSPLYKTHSTHYSSGSVTPTAPPAHQNSNSRCSTPHTLMSSPSPHMIPNQIVYQNQIQEQPQNLVKIENKSKSIYNNNNNNINNKPIGNQIELQSTSNTGYPCISLIQQGLVPNPLYTASSTTQSTTTTSSNTSVIAKPQPNTSQTHSTQLFTRPGPGIISGIPIRNTNVRSQLLEEIPISRQNSIPYYGDMRTNVLTPQKYAQNMNVKNEMSNPSVTVESAALTASICSYSDVNRVAKISAHMQQTNTNQHQINNISLYHRTQSPLSSHSLSHSPRLSSVAIPPSPYGPPPGMVAVSSSVASLSHVTPPLAHSGIHPLNLQNSNSKRKSIGEMTLTAANITAINKKQRIIESPLQQNAENGAHCQQDLYSTSTSTTLQTQSQHCNDNETILQTITANNSEKSVVNVVNDVPTKLLIMSNESNETICSTDLIVSSDESFANKYQNSNSNSNSNSIADKSQLDSKLSVDESVKCLATNSVSSSSSHPKLKKAWLQRHSDEDKVGVTTTTTSSSPTTTTTTTTTAATITTTTTTTTATSSGNCNGNNASNSSGNASQTDANNVNTSVNVNASKCQTNEVLNGEIRKLDDSKDGSKKSTEDDETSSASETEQELNSPNKNPKRKSQSHTRVSTRKNNRNNLEMKDIKKRKTNIDTTSSKCEENVKMGKENNEEKKRLKEKKESEKDLKSPPKRGRKPKSNKCSINAFKSSEKDKPSLKKMKLQKGKLDRISIAELKKSGAPFLQIGSCVDVAPKLQKCRECRMTPTQRNRKPTIFCRFYDYRKLAYKNNVLTIAGFSQPQDADEEDLKLWLPSAEPPKDVDVETAKFLIAHVGDQFCDLVKQEKEAQLLHMGSCNKNITWKRVVQGVREMCDVCETTLFNIHWVCDKCGFVVCIDCYKARKVGSIKEEACPAKDRDGFQWLLCNNRQQHEPQKLEVTQIIAAAALSSVGRTLHSVRSKWNISSNCSCNSNTNNSCNTIIDLIDVRVDVSPKKSNGYTKQVLSAVCLGGVNGVVNTDSKAMNWKTMNGTVAIIKQETTTETLTGYSSESGNSPLSFFADVALTSEKLITKTDETVNELKPKKNSINCIIKSELENELTETCDGKEEDDNKHSTLRELLMGPTNKSTKDVKSNGSPVEFDSQNNSENHNNNNDDNSNNDNNNDTIVNNDNTVNTVNTVKKEHTELQHFMRRYVPLRKEADPLPIISRTLEETKKIYPNVAHSWFCCGRLLVLHDPKNSNNINIFQEQWIRGQPVMVRDTNKYLNSTLWHPDSFSREFGDVKNDLVNCRNGDILAKQPMKKFWDGFENLQNRMRDKNNEYMLLKLKDWPPDEEFSELLPTRYRDLMNSLPLPEYTNRNGVLNLASRLPNCFVRPDLGPKMYSAYGSTLYPDKGTTNLHLDISDAVNVMIFVGIPKENSKNDVLNAVDSSGCDELMKKRVRDKGVKVGAIWHIYNARDADKIRDLLNKVAIERGETLEPHHDPIHDQSWYLDHTLRDRLYNEYRVQGYTICQCLGDAIFIPAGAPHQVRNLNSCIKVAGDFVSPENVSHCFNLTQEFRQLSDTHTNHEDKLQIKNIIYHTVKDALSCLKNQQCVIDNNIVT